MTTERSLTKHAIAAITRVKEYIDTHPLENKSTDELAEIGNIGRNLLQSGFLQLFETKIKEYCTAQKMKIAAQLLDDGVPVNKVAQTCGYRSHSSFSTAFKKVTGQSPRDWGNQAA